METGGDPPVDTGPPPDARKGSGQLNGSIAVTELHAAQPPSTAPRGAVAAEASIPASPTPPQETGTTTSPATGLPPTSLKELLSTPSQHTPLSFDVFADTSATSSTPTPVSRRFEDDGDADMGSDMGAPPPPPPQPLSNSSLTKSLRQEQPPATATSTVEGSAAPPASTSRRFEEDGDADMETTAATSTPPLKESSLQESLRTSSSSSSGSTESDTSDLPRPHRRKQMLAPETHAAPKSPAPTQLPVPGSMRDRPKASPRRARPARAQTPTVWSAKGAAQLRAALGGIRPAAAPTAPPAGSQAELQLAPYYACATKAVHLRRDGDQRAMLKSEKKTLYHYVNHDLHLSEPPTFLKETHTSAERDVFADFHRDHLGFRLYAILPAGVTISDANAKYQFCYTALLAAEQDPTAKAALERLFMQARTITCEPKSRISLLRFVRPDERVTLNDFKFGNGSIRLQATDSLTTDVPRIGLDEGARKRLYHVFFRGHSALPHGVVRAIGSHIAQIPVLDLELVESIGLSDFTSPMWKLTYDQITCPPALQPVRRLQVQYGSQSLAFDVRHPRVAQRMACSKCLSIRHLTPACNNKHAEEGLARHTAKISMPPIELAPKITVAISPKKFERQLASLRMKVSPNVSW